MDLKEKIKEQIKTTKSELQKWENIANGDRRYKEIKKKQNVTIYLQANQKIFEIKQTLDKLYIIGDYILSSGNIF